MGNIIMIKKLFEKITGIEKLKQNASLEIENAARGLAELKDAAAQLAAELKDAADKAIELERVRLEQEAEQLRLAQESKMTPKELATAKGEPYVAVIDTHIDSSNLRNGFFELDWNDIFISQLKKEGYGFDGDPDEEIADRWFRVLCTDEANESGIDMSERGAGYINVRKLVDNKSEIS
jgi:hypothetical protein